MGRSPFARRTVTVRGAGLGRSVITVVTSPPTVLDERRAATLHALCEVLIPGAGSPAEYGDNSAVARVDGLCADRPAIRSQVFWLLDGLERLTSGNGPGFADCDEAQRNIAATSMAREQPAAFRLVRQVVCEDYYMRTPVRSALEQETGWRFWNSLCGSSMGDFDESLLVTMRQRPACYRLAP